MRPAASGTFEASATLNGRHICAACRSTGCGLVSRPWITFGNAEMHRGDVVAGEAVLLPQRQHRVDAGGDPRRRGVRFHQHVHEQEFFAESVLDQRRIEAVGIGAREAARSLDHVGRAGEAVLRQQRRGDAALRGMRGLDALAGRARVVELRDAAGIAAGEPDRREDFLVGAAEQQPAGGRGGAEHVAGAGALEAALEVAGLHRKPDPDRHLVARDHRRHDVRPGRADMLGGRQRRRPGGDAGMQHRADMRVVGIEARAEGDVHERRVLRIERLPREQHMRRAGLCDHADIVARPLAPRQPRADRADAQMIEQQPAELAPHVVRQLAGSSCAANDASARVDWWVLASTRLSRDYLTS